MNRVAMLAAVAALVAVIALASTAWAKVVVTIEPVNDSGVSGIAGMGPAGDGSQTLITVDLEDLEPDTSHVNHIHEGASCDDIGAVVGALANIEADADGNGTATTTVDIPFEQIADGGHLLAFHAGPDLASAENAAIIACGAIPAVTAELEPVVLEEEAGAPAEQTPAVQVPPTTGSGGFLDQGNVGASWTVALAGALAVLGLAGFGLGFAARRIRR